MISVRRTVLFALLFFAASFAASAGAPRRVVSTFLCTDEYVFRLIPQDRIAALSFEATDRHPVVSTIADRVQDIRTIHPSAETVLALHPDLVLMYAGVNQRLRDTLKSLHIKVLDVPWANTLDDIRKTTAMLGDALGARDRAQALIRDMDRKIAAAQMQAPATPVATVLFQPNGYALSSAYTDALMAAAGLHDEAPEMALSRTGRLPVETLVAKAPQLLILGGEEKSGSAMAYRVLHHPALRSLQGRTHVEYAVLNELMCPGPWSAGAATAFSRLARKALDKPADRH